MKKKYYNSKAQSTIEYLTVSVCIVAAIYVMSIYIKRSIQGSLRSAADQIGEQYSANNTRSNMVQYVLSTVPTTVNVTTKFIQITNPVTGALENREIAEVTRYEVTTEQPFNPHSPIPSFEATGRLSDENLF
jgi:uncharacterized protein (UPF0333 family)